MRVMNGLLNFIHGGDKVILFSKEKDMGISLYSWCPLW